MAQLLNIMTGNYKRRKNIDKYFNLINYLLVNNEYTDLRYALMSPGTYTTDPFIVDRMSKLFLKDLRCDSWFGISSDIVNTMKNIIFSGNIKIKTQKEDLNKIIDELYYDGDFVETLKETYKNSALSVNGKSYMFFDIRSTYNEKSGEKLYDEIVDFVSVPAYQTEKSKNMLKRYYYEHKQFGDAENDDIYRFEYQYTLSEDGKVNLKIVGFDSKEMLLPEEEVKRVLNIDNLEETYDFMPYIELNLIDGMLPNALFIENALSEAIYFQKLDLSNSQTQTYLSENAINQNYTGSKTTDVYDRYSTTRVMGQINIDGSPITHIEGKSAIQNIERNLALNVVRACLDAKMSPVSLGYSLIDTMASNTDVGVAKERVTIRLRENHIEILKVFISKAIQTYLYLKGYIVDVNDIAVMFTEYITPSYETVVNTLSKAVQFGIMSREQAIRKLNKDELSDKEIEGEFQRVLMATTQQDYNVEQSIKKENNVLNGTQIEE